MLKKINNIKQKLESLREDAATKEGNTQAILKISQELEEIIKEDYDLKELDQERRDNY